MDRTWWKHYLPQVKKTFHGERYSCAVNLRDVTTAKSSVHKNSGAGAIALADYWGAQRIILIGYDGQKTGGKAHWHGDHPVGLGNAGSIEKWPMHFRKLALKAQVINCTRETILDCFPRVPLETALNENSCDLAMERAQRVQA
tara:strand:+ start:3360 stop:3788 length:429 start_codon:yes stop_codon:yes gene_type:complete